MHLHPCEERQSTAYHVVPLVLHAAGSRMVEAAGSNAIQKQLEALNQEAARWEDKLDAAKVKAEIVFARKMVGDLSTRRKNLEDKLIGR